MVDMFKVMATIDRRIYFLLFLTIMIGGSLYPVVLPMPITNWTQTFYNKVNEVQPGDILIVHMGAGPEVRLNMWSAYKLILWQFIQKRPRIIWMTTWPNAFPVGEMLLNDPLIKDAIKMANYVKGVNFTDIGFVYGEPALVNLAKDFHGFTENKFKGTWLDEVKDMNDIQYYLCFGASGDYHWAAKQISLIYKTKIFTVSDPGLFPTHIIYMQAGNFYASIEGVTGSAEYELLTKHYGEAVGRMGIISMTHLAFVLIIIIGNIGYFGWERKERAKPFKSLGEKHD
jgi:hypothetical protein